MAKAWINDRWLKAALVTTAQGHTSKEEPSAYMKHSLSKHTDDPENAKVPERYRAKDFGKGSRWEVRWRIDGITRRKLFRYRGEAEAFMAEIEDRIRSNRYMDPRDSCRPLRQAADLWQQGLAGTIKGSTEGRYRRELRVWVLPQWGDVALKDISTARIQRWYVSLADGTAPYGGERGSASSLSASSIRSVGKIVLGSILDVAVENRWIDTNPVAKAKVPHNRAVQRRIYLTPQEIKILAGQMDEANATVIYLLAYTGLRIGEALSLRCGDVDLGRNRINVLRTQSVDVDSHIVETLPKGNRTRFVPIPSQLLPRIKDLLDGHGPEDYLLRGPRGGRQTTTNWRNRVWAPALRDAGMQDIEGLVIHSLCHTYASLAIKAGADVKTLQAVLGHASATETLDTYADLWPNRTGEVAEVIGQDIQI